MEILTLDSGWTINKRIFHFSSPPLYDFCIQIGRTERQTKGGKGGAKNYQAFLAGRKPGQEVAKPKVIQLR